MSGIVDFIFSTERKKFLWLCRPDEGTKSLKCRKTLTAKLNLKCFDAPFTSENLCQVQNISIFFRKQTS